jgi:hypothetical protein
MTTGRINQVTVRPSRRSARAWRGYWSASRRPLPSPEFFTRRIEFNVTRTAQSLSVVIQRTRPHRNGQPSPPISHASGRFPPVQRTKVGAFDGDCQCERPPNRVGCKRNAADLLRISCNQKRWPLASNPHLSPIAREQRAEARSRV